MKVAIVLLSLVAVALTASVEVDIENTAAQVNEPVAANDPVNACVNEMISGFAGVKHESIDEIKTCGKNLFDSFHEIRDLVLGFVHKVQERYSPEIREIADTCKSTSPEPFECIVKAFMEHKETIAAIVKQAMAVHDEARTKFHKTLETAGKCVHKTIKSAISEDTDVIKHFKECLPASSNTK